jgi:hypothetical protein
MKKKKVIMIIGGIIALMCWGGYWSTMNSVKLPSVEYFGMFRYRIDRISVLYHDRDRVAIEPAIFAYQFSPPYIYTYGLSGYTKTDVVPFGKIEKIANMSYYNSIPDDEEIIGPYRSPLKLVQEKFGSQLVLINTFQDISAKDYQIYIELQREGKESKTDYFDYMKKIALERKDYEKNDSLIKIEQELDSLQSR